MEDFLMLWSDQFRFRTFCQATIRLAHKTTTAIITKKKFNNAAQLGHEHEFPHSPRGGIHEYVNRRTVTQSH